MKIQRLAMGLLAGAFLLFGSTVNAQCNTGGCGMSMGDGNVMPAPVYQDTIAPMMGGNMGGCAPNVCGNMGAPMMGGCDTGCGGSSGPYVSIFGGVHTLDDQTSTGYQRLVEAEFDEGFIGGGSIGMKRGRLRTEIEYTYRTNTPESIDFNGVTIAANTVGGRNNTHSGMLNFALDLGVGNNSWQPYVGGGVGFAYIGSDLSYGGLPARLNGDDTSLAYQGFAGISKQLRNNAQFFAEYRYFEAHDPKLNRFGGPAINGSPQNLILDSEYASHGLLFGLRMSF